jgi:hypothetical protein
MQCHAKRQIHEKDLEPLLNFSIFQLYPLEKQFPAPSRHTVYKLEVF